MVRGEGADPKQSPISKLGQFLSLLGSCYFTPKPVVSGAICFIGKKLLQKSG
jgi:hypothetical protein